MNHCWPGPTQTRAQPLCMAPDSICWFFEGPAMRWPRMATSCWPVVAEPRVQQAAGGIDWACRRPSFAATRRFDS